MPPKTKKATSQQYKTLVDLVAESECIRWGKGTPEAKKAAWENIALQINALGGGVQKNGDGWKKSFTELKSHIKSKIRGKKCLNDTEKKCADVAGLHVSCVGMTEVPELGMAEPRAEQTEAETFTLDEEGILIPVVEPELPIIETETIVGLPDPEVEAKEEDNAQSISVEQTNVTEASKPTTKMGIKKKPRKSTQCRRPKTSVEQYEIYLNFKRFNHKNAEEAFETLCHQLNSEGCYPSIQRSPAKWKRIFSEWESKVKAKARRIHFEQELTGGGIPIIEILTNLEKKLLEVLSKILIYGHPKIIELGFTKKSKKNQACTFKTKMRKIGRKHKNHLRERIELQEILYKNNKLIKKNLRFIGNCLSILNEALANFLNAINKM